MLFLLYKSHTENGMLVFIDASVVITDILQQVFFFIGHRS